jgi:hypothetical protein
LTHPEREKAALKAAFFIFVSFEQPGARDSRDDQKDRDDVIEQMLDDQDEGAGEKRDDWLKMCEANVYFLFPY